MSGKLKSKIMAMAFGIIVASTGYAKTHSLFGFIRHDDGHTTIDSVTQFHSVSEVIQKGWFTYVVELKIEKSYVDDKSGKAKKWTDKVSVEFDSKSNAYAFSKMMNSDKATDLYYNFDDNSHNSIGEKSSCRIAVLGIFCREFPVKVINFKTIDGDELYAYDQDDEVNRPLSEYLDSIE